MLPTHSGLLLLGLLGLSWSAGAYSNGSTSELLTGYTILDDGCKCPSCFNCNNPSDTCHQFAKCLKANGQCDCPTGFGGEDCSVPLCGSLPEGNNREPRPDGQQRCECDDGWTGINCNVCMEDKVCNALMPPHDGGVRSGGVCHKQDAVVKENYQMCDVTNKPILDQLGDQKPQVTFSCNAKDKACNFQCRWFSPLGSC
jgi:hypothetical protein